MISKAPDSAPAGGLGLMAQRLELKYLIDRTTRTALEQDLAGLMRRDGYAGADGSYYTRSLYFDTPDYRCYAEKLAGEAARYKLRIRAYGQNPLAHPHVRFEIKARYAATINKLTSELPTGDWPQVYQAICRRTMAPVELLAGPKAPREFFRLLRLLNMEPKVLLQYRRTAFERRELNRCRVNFDDQITATRRCDLLGSMDRARRLLQYGHCVFEIKVDGSLPYWLHALIVKYNLQLQAFSKYCHAVRSELLLSPAARESIGLA